MGSMETYRAAQILSRATLPRSSHEIRWCRYPSPAPEPAAKRANRQGKRTRVGVKSVPRRMGRGLVGAPVLEVIFREQANPSGRGATVRVRRTKQFT